MIVKYLSQDLIDSEALRHALSNCNIRSGKCINPAETKGNANSNTKYKHGQ